MCLLACLVLGPFASAIAAHHADDADAVVAMLDEAANAAFTNKASDHPPSLPAGDHDCHGCGIAMPHEPIGASARAPSSQIWLPPAYVVDSRIPGAEFRPPRA